MKEASITSKVYPKETNKQKQRDFSNKSRASKRSKRDTKSVSKSEKSEEVLELHIYLKD